jgi:hypothetical protein
MRIYEWLRYQLGKNGTLIVAFGIVVVPLLFHWAIGGFIGVSDSIWE